MGVNYQQYAAKLKIKPVWAKSAENDTGYLTPEQLYRSYAPFEEEVEHIHATVGSNTLPYFAHKVDSSWRITKVAGSIRDGRLVLAHQLIPRDDYTIFDMVPAGFGCGHANPGSWRGFHTLNLQARGYEIENLQNGDRGEHFTESQYIKLALSIAYHTALQKLPNLRICSHWDSAMGSILRLAGQGNVQGAYTRAREAHTDPNAGPFDWGRFWGHLFEIRTPEGWPGELWQMPLWDGHSP